MANNAKVGLTGRLTKDPTQKTWQNTTVVSFTVAVSTTKKEGDKYIADFYNVSVWGKTGEYLLPKISKGSLVQVYGEQIIQTYKDSNGVERVTPSVRATDVIPLTKKEETHTQTDTNDDPPPF